MKAYFGLKIKIKGYLKKSKIKFVTINLNEDYPTENQILINDGEIEQSRFSLIMCDNEKYGFIIGKKKIAITYIYSIDCDDYHNEKITVTKADCIDCYIVYYQPNRKIYVPINLVEKVEE